MILNTILPKRKNQKIEILCMLTIALSMMTILGNYIFFNIQQNKATQKVKTINNGIKGDITNHIQNAKNAYQDRIKHASSIKSILQPNKSLPIFFIDGKTNNIEINQKKIIVNKDFLYNLHKISHKSISTIISDNAQIDKNSSPSLFFAVPYIRNNQFVGTAIFQHSLDSIYKIIKSYETQYIESLLFKNEKSKQLALFPTTYQILNPINISDNKHQKGFAVSTDIIISPQWYLQTTINMQTANKASYYINMIMTLLLIISAFALLITSINHGNQSLFAKSTIRNILLYALPILLLMIIVMLGAQSINLYQTIDKNILNKTQEQQINSQKISTLLESNLKVIASKSFDINHLYSINNSKEIQQLLQENHFIEKVTIYSNKTLQEITLSDIKNTPLESQPQWIQQNTKSSHHWTKPHYTNEDTIIFYISVIDNHHISIQVNINKLLVTIFKNQKLDNKSTTLIYNDHNDIIYYSKHLKKTNHLKIKDLIENNLVSKEIVQILKNKNKKEDLIAKNKADHVIVNKLSSTNWTIIQQYTKKIMHLEYNVLQIILLIILLCSLLLIIYVCYYLYLQKLHETSLHKTMLIISLGMACLSMATLFVSYQYMEHKTNSIMYNLFYNFNQILEKNIDHAKTSQNLIPTGVFLESFNPLDNSFSINIWQKIPSQEKNITAPTILNALKTDLKTHKLYEEKGDKEIKIGWKIAGKLISQKNQVFYYPFDSRIVQFIIGSEDKNNYKIFTIDNDSYTTLKPQDKPGVAPKISIKQFMIDTSFFSYEEHQTQMGIIADKPDHLSFNIVLKRNLLNSFLLYLLPLLVIIFTVMFASRNKVSKAEGVQMKLVYGQASLLFALILIHQNLRQRIQLTSSSYMELLMLLGYFAIIFPYIELIYPSSTKKILLIKKFCIISFMSLALFAITFYSFYR